MDANNGRTVHQQLRTFDSLISPDMCSIWKHKSRRVHVSRHQKHQRCKALGPAHKGRRPSSAGPSPSSPVLWRRVRWHGWGFVPAGFRRAWPGECWWSDHLSALLCTLWGPEGHTHWSQITKNAETVKQLVATWLMRFGPKIRLVGVAAQNQTWSKQNLTFSKSANDLFLLAWATHFSASVYKNNNRRRKSKWHSAETSMMTTSTTQRCWTGSDTVCSPETAAWIWLSSNKEHDNWGKILSTYLSAGVSESQFATDQGLDLLWSEKDRTEKWIIPHMNGWILFILDDE